MTPDSWVDTLLAIRVQVETLDAAFEELLEQVGSSLSDCPNLLPLDPTISELDSTISELAELVRVRRQYEKPTPERRRGPIAPDDIGAEADQAGEESEGQGAVSRVTAYFRYHRALAGDV